MATNLIPPLNTKGIYTLKSPWVSDLTRVYQCTGINRFSALSAKNVDVFAKYYEPKGLSRAVYEADNALGAAILTLSSEFAAPIEVPSTYIISYPNMAAVRYNHTLLSASLGALYEGIPLDGVVEQMATAIESVIGVTPTINIHVAPSKEVVTPEQHQTIEAARNANITNRTTNAQLLLQKDQTIASLTQKVEILTKICKDNGWVGS